MVDTTHDNWSLYKIGAVYDILHLILRPPGSNHSHEDFWPWRYTKILSIYSLAELFYIFTTTALKVSLGLFFLHLLIQKWQRLVFHIVISLSILVGFSYIIISVFQCGHHAKVVDSLLGSNECLSKDFILATQYLYGIVNIFANMTFVIISIRILIGSDIEHGAKISVSILIALGAIGSISSVMRIVYLESLTTSPPPSCKLHYLFLMEYSLTLRSRFT